MDGIYLIYHQRADPPNPIARVPGARVPKLPIYGLETKQFEPCSPYRNVHGTGQPARA